MVTKLPWQLPEREEDSQFIVELLKLVKSAEDKLWLILTFPQESHHIDLHRAEKQPVWAKSSMRRKRKIENKMRLHWCSHSACLGYISSERRRWRRGRCVPLVSEYMSSGRKRGLARHWPADQRIVAGQGCG